MKDLGIGALALLLASAATAVWAQEPPPDLSQGRVGPRSTPPTAPTFAQPAPSLVPPPADVPLATAPRGGTPVTEVRVTSIGPHDPALPPHGWTPPEPAPDLRLEHQPGQALDEAWVRRQFALNGLPGPGGGVPRALALVQLVNRAYLSAGFINSGVVVQPSATPGVLELRLVYGGLVPPAEGQPAIAVGFIGKAKGLDAAFVQDRMPSAARRPLNALELERDFRLLAEDPAIRTINADLRPGSRPGEASLAISVYPQDRFDLYLTAANNRSPSVGGERLAAGGSMRNVLGGGDLFSAEAGITEGVEDVTVSYVFPLISPKNSFSVRGAYNNAAVVDSLLAPLDISARDRAVEVGFTRKFIDTPLLPAAEAGRWTPARTFSAGMLVAWRTSTAYLLGEPFSFAPGAVDGRTEYTALRFIADYVIRNTDQVFAISLTGTQGLDGTGTDIPGLPVPKQHFHAVLAQVNYARRLSPRGLELRARLYGQWADSVLYSGERFSAGGETTVRGYRENLVLADKGAVGSVEIAQPLSLSGRQGAARAFDWGAFTVSAFADGAVMRNKAAPQPERSLYSIGASLAWTPADALSARITYGEALKTIEAPGEKDLQDRGVSFRVTLWPLRLMR